MDANTPSEPAWLRQLYNALPLSFVAILKVAGFKFAAAATGAVLSTGLATGAATGCLVVWQLRNIKNKSAPKITSPMIGNKDFKNPPPCFAVSCKAPPTASLVSLAA